MVNGNTQNICMHFMTLGLFIYKDRKVKCLKLTSRICLSFIDLDAIFAIFLGLLIVPKFGILLYDWSVIIPRWNISHRIFNEMAPWNKKILLPDYNCRFMFCRYTVTLLPRLQEGLSLSLMVMWWPLTQEMRPSKCALGSHASKVV